MKIRNKILLAWLATLLLMGIAITEIWYSTSQKFTSVYLKNVSESTMQDAYHAFEYLLTDTSYMATLIATNKSNIIEPVMQLNQEEISLNGQWNQTYLNNRRIIMNYIKSLNGYKYYISGIAVAANKECVFSTNYIIQDKGTLYEDIIKLDQKQLKRSMVMMEPLHLEGFIPLGVALIGGLLLFIGFGLPKTDMSYIMDSRNLGVVSGRSCCLCKGMGEKY